MIFGPPVQHSDVWHSWLLFVKGKRGGEEREGDGRKRKREKRVEREERQKRRKEKDVMGEQ